MASLNDDQHAYYNLVADVAVKNPKRIFLTSTGIAGGPTSLLVNGSVTPVVFSAAPLTGMWAVANLEVSYTVNATLVPSNFGGIATLTNGCQLILIDNGVEVDLTEGNYVKQNADWFSLSTDCSLVDWKGTHFTMDVHFPIYQQTGAYIKLDSARGQKIGFKVSDNLTTAFTIGRVSCRYIEV
jgi:hypothetical protein